MEHQMREVESNNIQMQLDMLDRISNLLTSSIFDLDLLLMEIAKITAQSLLAKGCTIRLLDKTTGEMIPQAAFGLSQRYLSKGSIIAAHSIFQELIETSRKNNGLVRITDVGNDPRVQYPREAIAEGICAIMASPLLRNDRTIGAISIYLDHPHPFTGAEEKNFRTIANQAAIAISLAQLYQEQLEYKKIEQELTIAADIQAKLMPGRIPEIAGVDVAGKNKPCAEVGGDFFDFIELTDHNFGMAVGDVSGKGIPAALLMATARTALRVQAQNVYEMREIIRRVNRSLCKDTREEVFVTLFYAVYDANRHRLTYVDAGHNYPLLFREDKVIPLETGGPLLGLLPEATYRENSLQLLPEDLLVIYTDGFVEIADGNGELFGENRLIHTIQACRHLPPGAIIDELETAVCRFGNLGTTHNHANYEDDRTIIILKIRQ